MTMLVSMMMLIAAVHASVLGLARDVRAECSRARRESRQC